MKGGLGIFKSIRSKMAVQFSILFLVILCGTGWFLFQKTKSTLQETTIENMQGTSGELSRQIEDNLNMAENSVNTIISSWTLQNILNEAAPFLYYRQNQQIQSMIKDASSSNDSLAAIQIYSPKYGYLGFNNSRLQPYEMKRNIFALAAESGISFEKMLWMASEEDMEQYPYIYGIRQITNFIGKEPLGYVMVLVNIHDLYHDSSLTGTSQQGHILLYDEQGNIIAGNSVPDPAASKYYYNLIRTVPSSGSLVDRSSFGANLIAHHSLNDAKWHTVVILPVSALTEKISYMQATWFWASLLTLLVIFISSWLLSLRISHPIKRMQRAMKKVERGEFNLVLPRTNVKEINDLGHSFNRMSRKIDTLIHQVYEVEISRQASELRELQAQINPHFLFNTLDSVYWLLVMKDQEEAASIIVSLSKLFRYSTEVRREVVTIREEFEHVRNYMHVQQIRFKMIKLKWHIGPGAEEMPILKLTVQPLVENAIHHGLEKNESGGMVDVRAVVEPEGVLVVTVKDDGAGIKGEKLEEIRELLTRFPSGAERPGGGIALENIYRRIKLFYGESGSMNIDSEWGQGTVVTIRLPSDQLKF
ncbi:putative sensor-like histidine kinase [compost metagenome]